MFSTTTTVSPHVITFSVVASHPWQWHAETEGMYNAPGWLVASWLHVGAEPLAQPVGCLQSVSDLQRRGGSGLADKADRAAGKAAWRAALEELVLCDAILAEKKKTPDEHPHAHGNLFTCMSVPGSRPHIHRRMKRSWMGHR